MHNKPIIWELSLRIINILVLFSNSKSTYLFIYDWARRVPLNPLSKVILFHLKCADALDFCVNFFLIGNRMKCLRYLSTLLASHWTSRRSLTDSILLFIIFFNYLRNWPTPSLSFKTSVCAEGKEENDGRACPRDGCWATRSGCVVTWLPNNRRIKGCVTHVLIL